jgi:L-alanine-DL-glutamate epimerase-like enolase superfamily enzyme
MSSSLKLSFHVEVWKTRIPFRITGRTRDDFKVILVELTDGVHIGRGEGLPVHYLGETEEQLCRQVEAVAGHLEQSCNSQHPQANRRSLLELMPPGAARNAVDGALWDLECKRTGRSIWELTGITPRPLTTVFTIGIEETPELMAVRAVEASEYPILKIKVDSDRPVERIAAIRAARPDAGLVVDANQGWTFEQLASVAPHMAQLGVRLIEQPLPRGRDECLEGYRSPVPLSADESCQHRGELDVASRRYQIINIKLDKAGGLTEALLLAESVRNKGLERLASNMGGTSLGMAPAFVVAQLCRYVELDGPLVLKHDRFPTMTCHKGEIGIPDRRLWG